MRSSTFALAALAAASLAGSASAAPAKSDHDQIVALENGFTAAFNAKDIGKIMSCYARQGLFVFDVTPPRQYVGWEAYRKDWQGLFKQFSGPVKMAISDLHVDVVGPVAWGHSIQDVTLSDAKGGKNHIVVRVTDVYRKFGGQWRIVQEHVSVPVDLDTGKADTLSKP